MDITVSSIWTATIFGSACIFIFLLLLKTDFIAKKLGPKWILVLFLLLGLRMVIPAEFHYTYSMYFKKILPPVSRFFDHDILPGKWELPVWGAAAAVWIGVCAVLVVRRYRDYKKMYRLINLLPRISVKELLSGPWEEKSAEYPEFENLSVVRSDMQGTPFLIGVRHPIVVLSDADYTQPELFYILAHEAMHLRKHDLLWKILVDLLRILYWWNPLFGVLEEKIFQLIEIRNDMRITENMSGEDKVGYLDCLFSTARWALKKEKTFALHFTRKNKKELEQRVDFIANGAEGHRIMKFLGVAAGTVIIFMSTCVILEPDFPPQEFEGMTAITEENSYLIENGDAYDVYIYFEGNNYATYAFQTEDLVGFHGIKIYEEGEAPKN